jgi:hypothetical protein
MIASSFEQGSSMNAKSIRAALRRERLLMCTYEPAGAVYSLDNGVPVSKKLAAELINSERLQADLFLWPNNDGLFPGFTQTWRAEG